MSRKTERDARREQDDAAASEDEGILRRWSRRKHEARREEREPSGTETAAAAPAVGAKAERPESDAEPERVLTDADMPPLDSLDENSDFSAFMSPGVSEGLRQAALRKLFRAPRLNQLCELESEYFDASGFQPLGNIVTHEMRAELEREAEKLKQRAQQALREELTPADEQPMPGRDAPPAADARDASGEIPSAPDDAPRSGQDGAGADGGERTTT